VSIVPLSVVRPVDLTGTYAYPRSEVARLERRGLLHRLLPGYYVPVPPDRIGAGWRPGLEAAAAGLGAAAYGPENAVLMGLSAARIHSVLPRAIAVAVVAVPRQHTPMALTDRPATVLFVRRDVDRLDAERIQVDLGAALVTGVEQTVLDLARRPDLGGMPDEARAAVRALLPRADRDTLDRLAADQRLRAARDLALTWA
jgi:predicted transcriptional regulator of viral defense system